MYLKSLKISESSPAEKIIRSVPFHNGLNIIVDESDDERGNNVGKTTFLKIIDICLGATDKKYIWTDSDTGSETRELKQYIQEKKVYAELIINNESREYVLKVDLFENGRKYINAEKLNAENYNEKLNNIIFNIEKPPSFRQLINKFVRIKQKDSGNSATLKYLHSTTSNNRYRNIYDFLFKLDDVENSAARLELEEEIQQISQSREKLFSLHQFSNLEDLKQRLKIVEKRTDELQGSIDTLINKQKFKQSLDEITVVKQRLNILNDSLNGAYFQKAKVENILQKENDFSHDIDENILNNFYEEVTTKIDNILKDFEELIEFNNKVKRNKIEYYTKRLERIKEDIAVMSKERNKLIDENQEVINIINENNFEEYEKKYKQLLRESQLYGELSNVFEIYTDLSNKIEIKTIKLQELNGSNEETDNITMFNNYFSRYTEEALGQRLYLFRNDEGFPIGISNFNEGFGSGYKKTITLLLDIAYVSFLNELNLNYPRFVIHDELEPVDEFNFEKIVNFIKTNDTQFVFGILNEKIKSYSFIEESDKVLKLSKDNKLFKV